LFGISPVEEKKRSALSSVFFFFKDITLRVRSQYCGGGKPNIEGPATGYANLLCKEGHI
jgi:hypothetical protein